MQVTMALSQDVTTTLAVVPIMRRTLAHQQQL